MRISQVAELLGLDPKDTIAEIEARRDQLTSSGFKLAKKLTASSGIDDQAVRELMAGIDKRRMEARKAQEEAERKKREADEAARRAEEEEKRRREEEERRKAAEEARLRADAELERRRAELARIAASAPPPPPAPAPAAAAPQQPPAPVEPAARQPAPPPPQQQQPAAQAQPPAPPRQQPPAQAQRPSPTTARQAGGPPPPRRSDQQGRPPRSGDQQRPTDRRRSGPAGENVGTDDLQKFLNEGMEPALPDEYRPRRKPDERGGGPAKGRGPKAAGDTAEDRQRTRRARPERGARKVGPTQLFRGAPAAKRGPAGGGIRGGGRPSGPGGRSKGGRGRGNRGPQKPSMIELRGDFTVGEFADKAKVQPGEIIGKLMLMGEMLTMNQIMNPDLAELIATDLGIELRITREGDEFDVERYLDIEDAEEELKPRPPVVTVMGHVDHGKTTLLDTIRKTNVVSGEAGGITQHIGAYFVNTDKGDIVFLDTPGHEAFTAMRARGADVTDLVILIVAANDGVKPQTVEAINHARAAEVPIIVAINKTDVDGANPERVKQELMRYEIVSEDLGGDTIMVNVSALKGDGVENLLEMVALQSEVLELTANPDRDALGTIVESHVDRLRGAVATVLVQQGTLRPGDYFLCGTEYGRVRAMYNDRGEQIEEAGPSHPVEILGLSGAPAAGEQFIVVEDEGTAREIADMRLDRRKARGAAANPHVTLDNLKDRIDEGEIKTLNLIVKADVQGSVEAIVSSLRKIESDKVDLRVLHAAAGGVTEGDIQLADASDAIVLGFNVRPDPAARQATEQLGVEVRLYTIIYDLLEEIKAAMLGLVDRETEEVDTGRAVVQKIFKVSKVGNIAGCLVEEGTVGKKDRVRVVRNGTIVWRGPMLSLRRVKDEVNQVQAGVECGISLDGFNDIKEGDHLETFQIRELEATLMSTPEKEE